MVDPDVEDDEKKIARYRIDGNGDRHFVAATFLTDEELVFLPRRQWITLLHFYSVTRTVYGQNRARDVAFITAAAQKESLSGVDISSSDLAAAKACCLTVLGRLGG